MSSETNGKTAREIADKIIQQVLTGTDPNRPSMAERIAAAITDARFSARRECERELAELGLTVAFQDEGVAEETFLDENSKAIADARRDGLREHVEACGLEFVMGHEAFRIAAPKDHILDDTGRVLKAPGPLRHTLDGVVVLDGQWVYYAGNNYRVDNGKIPVSIPLYSCGSPTGEYRDVSVEVCYSTREAAIAAKEQTP